MNWIYAVLAFVLGTATAGDPSSTRTPGRSYRGRLGSRPFRVWYNGGAGPWAWSSEGKGGTASTASRGIWDALEHIAGNVGVGDGDSLFIEALDDSGASAEPTKLDSLPSSAAVGSLAVWRVLNGWAWKVTYGSAFEEGISRSRAAASLAAADPWKKLGAIASSINDPPT